jgi:putative colanic acid biosynthesis acetyltransferase WcaF
MNETLKVSLKDYNPGNLIMKKNIFLRCLWYVTNNFIFRSYLFPFYSLKRSILNLYGAKVGNKVIIKPGVNIKYPWLLEIGAYSWIGECVWIDNLALVKIGNNVCVSQGALLLTGNHNYKKTGFDLMIGQIVLEEGCWIGAKSVVCPGVICKTYSVLNVNSVAVHDLEPHSIYGGNPAAKIRERIIIK